MFGKRLKEKRIAKHLNQTELARIVNVSSSMINQIERGTKQASAPLIAELAIALGCTTDSLIYGDK